MSRPKIETINQKYLWTFAICLTIGIEIAAMLSGSDASWDLRNYHLYDPFALLNKPNGVDIAPAHLQTFFSPTLDLLFYAVVRHIPSAPAVNALLALPQAAALSLGLAIGARLLRPRTTFEWATLAAFMVVSATGVAGTSTLASAMSEMLPAAFVLGAVLLLVPPDLEQSPSYRRLFGAGLLAGAACGLKLTSSYMVVAIALSTLVIPRRNVVQLVSRPFVLGIGVLLAAAALSGYWWLHQWQLYGNPLFPMANNVFRSPWAIPDSFVDTTFLPRSFLQAVSAPWSWALHVSHAASESRLRDPRFSLALIAAVLCLTQLAVSRPRWRPWPVRFLATLFIVGFIVWRLQFSIYRYLAPLEVLTGPMLAFASLPLARRLQRVPALLAASVLLLAGLFVITVAPNLLRAPRGTPPLAVDLGPLPPDSLVLLLDNEPMAYLAAFADPRIRFVATHDFFMTLDDTNPMQPLVQQAITAQQGPIWGLDCPAERPHEAEQTLMRYHLTRGECRVVQTNLSPATIRLCRLWPASPP